MSSSLNSALLQQLVSSSSGSRSPVLLVIRRWQRRVGKQLALGLVSLLVLLNVGALNVDALNVGALNVDAALPKAAPANVAVGRPQMSAQIMAVSKPQALDTHTSALDAHLTHHHLLRSRLALSSQRPYPPSYQRTADVSRNDAARSANSASVNVAEVH